MPLQKSMPQTVLEVGCSQPFQHLRVKPLGKHLLMAVRPSPRRNKGLLNSVGWDLKLRTFGSEITLPNA
jgi:hypothetical protein